MSLAAWIERVQEPLAEAYSGAGPCHDLGHAIRVAGLALRIAAPTADREALVLAALFHDAGRATDREDHEVASAQVARAALGRVGAPELQIAAVEEAIRGHRDRPTRRARDDVRGHDEVAAALRDADRLDALGLVGFARVYLFVGEHGWRSEIAPDVPTLPADALRLHWAEKLRRLADKMETPQGAALARRRAARMLELLEELERELLDSTEGTALEDVLIER